MRFYVHALSALVLAAGTAGCDGCQSKPPTISEAERTQALASALAAPSVSATPKSDSIGHAINVIPGQGPKRIEWQGGRLGALLPILPGQGIGPIRIGATKATIERLMGVPCEDSTETLCRYIGRGVEFKLEQGAATEMRLSRRGREAKRAPDGTIIEYGFFNGAFLPDYYFGMTPQAMQEVLGAPERVEQISPIGADGFSERHIHDGVVLEYDRWSNGKLVLGAAIITKSETAAKRNEETMAKLQKHAKDVAEAGKGVPPITRPR
jgi:hypothetical protein